MQLNQFFLTLLLNSLIFIGVFQCYLSLKITWKNAQIFLKNQEIHNTAFQYLKQDIQSAGYIGCRTRDQTFPLYINYSEYNPEYRYYRFNQSIYGFKADVGNCLGKMPETACNRVIENTSVLILYNIPQKIMTLTKKQITSEQPLIVKDCLIQKKSLALVSDCQQGDLFIVTEVDNNQIFHQKILGFNQYEYFSKCYNQNAEVTELQTVAYYLAKPVRLQESTKSNKLSLFRDDFLHPAEEIITDIIDIQFKYGIVVDDDTNFSELNQTKNSADKKIEYKNAEEIKDWKKVTSLQITIETEYKNEWEIEFTLRNKI